jgi:hypothetical protein
VVTHVLTDPELTTANWSVAFPELSSSGASIAISKIEGCDVELFPFFVSRPQAYFWSRAWQAGERSALGDIAAGETMRFDDPQDAIRWLLEVDDDELDDDTP